MFIVGFSEQVYMSIVMFVFFRHIERFSFHFRKRGGWRLSAIGTPEPEELDSPAVSAGYFSLAFSAGCLRMR